MMTGDKVLDYLEARLRQYEGRDWEVTACYNALRDAAADAIRDLRAERAPLRQELEAIRDGRGRCGACGSDATGEGAGMTTCCPEAWWQDVAPEARARAALSETERDR